MDSLGRRNKKTFVPSGVAIAYDSRTFQSPEFAIGSCQKTLACIIFLRLFFENFTVHTPEYRFAVSVSKCLMLES